MIFLAFCLNGMVSDQGKTNFWPMLTGVVSLNDKITSVSTDLQTAVA